MELQGALIREQGIEFAVVIVKRHVLDDASEADGVLGRLQVTFGVPVVLMAQDLRGRPSYYGRPDISRFMSRVPLQRVPWRRFTVT